MCCPYRGCTEVMAAAAATLDTTGVLTPSAALCGCPIRVGVDAVGDAPRSAYEPWASELRDNASSWQFPILSNRCSLGAVLLMCLVNRSFCSKSWHVHDTNLLLDVEVIGRRKVTAL